MVEVSTSRSPSTITWYQDAKDIARIVREAFHLAGTGRPGPVLIDVPKDVQNPVVSNPVYDVPGKVDLPGYRLPPPAAVLAQIDEVLAALASSRRRPDHLLRRWRRGLRRGGGGAARVCDQDRNPCRNDSVHGLGSIPSDHYLSLNMLGMHGTVYANYAVNEADLLLALGVRFDSRVTGKLDSFAPGAAVVHADIDPAEISKNRRADVPIVGDCKEVITELIAAVAAEFQAGHRADLAAWWSQLDAWRSTYPLGYDQPGDGSLAPQYVIERIGKIAGPDAIYVAGVGQHQMWAAQFISHERPGHWLNSGGPRHHGLRGARRDGRQGGQPGPPACGRSTGTAASR